MEQDKRGKGTTSLTWRIPAALALLLGGLVLVNGCAGLLALAEYAAAASTIKSFLDRLNPDDPTYTVSGYVYVDRENDLVSVQADATLPSDGRYQVYADALLTLGSTPPRTTHSRTNGYFQFTGIPQNQTTHILTITTPTGTQIQFTVRLDKPSIQPLPSN